ncbi:hypothetical protein GW537_18890 (plasmid) [Piscirickettsia salmonis]|uniref:hypothetical protein n=1 Tax=Piscirickettsia salmonis TaxID=1238 RepID=UPI00137C074A|nr:hypothetical protein [Piscirickettsia salmonis]QHS31082.1 hypothetical protein GW537_18890 [Piscirickettsia salmonis]
MSIRAFAEKYNLNRNYVNRLFKVDKIPESVVLALPMIELSASQFEEIAIRIKDNQLPLGISYYIISSVIQMVR